MKEETEEERAARLELWAIAARDANVRRLEAAQTRMLQRQQRELVICVFPT